MGSLAERQGGKGDDDLRPSLAHVLPSYAESEAELQRLRAAYEPTPVEVRRLFTDLPAALETDGWLVEAILARDTALFIPPQWVKSLVTIWSPTIKCDPWKSPGFWRINSDSREWYVTSEDLRRHCEP